MADLAQGYRADIILNAGDVVRIGTTGTATVTPAYGAPSGVTTLTAQTREFGPFSVPAKLVLVAVSGPATYRVKEEAPPLITRDAEGGPNGLVDPLTGSPVSTNGAVDFEDQKYMIASSRLYMPTVRVQATVASLQFQATSIIMRSPPYPVVSPRFVFPGFICQSSVGEVDLGNDLPLEAAWFEPVVGGQSYQLSFGGSNAGTIPNGGFLVNDENSIVIPPNTEYRIRSAFGPVPLNGYYPSGSYTMQEGKLEAGTTNSTSRASLVASAYPTVAAGYNVGSQYGPCLMVAKGWERAGRPPVVLGVGDSIGWGDANHNSVNAVDGVFGYIGRGMNSEVGGRTPFANWCVPGTRFSGLAEVNTTDAQSGFSRRAAILRALNFPYTTIVCEMGINTVANADGANATARAQFVRDQAFAAWTYLKSLGNKWLAQTTMTPQTAAIDDPSQTVNSLQWTSTDTTKQYRVSDNEHVVMDGYIMTKPAPLDAVIDVRPYFQADAGAGARKWKAPNLTYTLGADAAAGQAVFTSNAAPPVGAQLVFEPGVLANYEVGYVKSVTGTGPYTVTMKGNLAKAHLSGTTAKAAYTIDGTHAGQEGHALGIPAIESAKVSNLVR